MVCGAYQKQFEENVTSSRKETVKNGLVREGNDWYLYKNGEIDKISSLAKNIHGLWYVKDGKIDFSFAGELICNEKLYKVEKGKAIEIEE